MQPDSSSGFVFASAVTVWQKSHGRHGLPWQHTQDPYRVWLSEVMLQQTQVSTVLGFYDRFLSCFPDVRALAEAPESDVLALWSGLGYYSRARNLHRCARIVVDEHLGSFPRSAQALQTLPGIGPSTAAAIASFCYGEPVSIYDGNVKRVLSRFLGFEGDLSTPAADRQLHQAAQGLVPTRHLSQEMPRYTQGLMDLGATVCTRAKPSCLLCPLQAGCAAYKSGQPERLPIKTRRTTRTSVAWHVLLLRRADGAVWLVKRPTKGIWASLLCPPVFESDAAMRLHPALAQAKAVEALPPFAHSLTHRELWLHPLVVEVSHQVNGECLEADGRWVCASEIDRVGLPVPVKTWLLALQRAV